MSNTLVLRGKEEGRAAVRTQEAAGNMDADRLQDLQSPGRLRNLEVTCQATTDQRGAVRARNPAGAGRADWAAKADTPLKSP